VAVESAMVPLGSTAPSFSLPDLDGEIVHRDQLTGPLLVAFLCNHCPYVKHIESRLAEVLNRHPELSVVGICTNDAEAYPDDAPECLAEQKARAGWRFPYLVDADQSVGRAYEAVCTPDFFLYDAAGRLAYRGAFDDSTPGNGRPVTGEMLGGAIQRVLRGEAVPEPHQPAMGCSIKWRE
jgi:peroxiredoxin